MAIRQMDRFRQRTGGQTDNQTDGETGGQTKTDLVVGQTGCREDRDFLTTGNAVHGVNGRDTRLNHLLWVDTRPRVDGLS